MTVETRIGVFIPTGAVHIIGPEAYTNLLCENNQFLQNIATVPSGDFQHATLELPFPIDANNDIETMTLSNIILGQTWCINLKRSTMTNKVILVTTKSLLKTARKWVDTQLPTIYNQNIADKIDATTIQHMTPRRLDKLIMTTASAMYSEQLIKRTSYNATQSNNNKQLNQPPKAHPLKPIVSFDDTSFPLLQQNKPVMTPITQQSNQTPPTSSATAQTYDYRAKLNRLTKELEMLINTKFKAAIAHLDAKFVQHLDLIKQKFECYLHQMEPMAQGYADMQNKQAALQAVHNDQKRDLSQLTHIVANLSDKIDAILVCIPNIQFANKSPMLPRSVGQS